MNIEKKKDKTKELSMTTKPKEQLVIKKLVTLPKISTPPSQALHVGITIRKLKF